MAVSKTQLVNIKPHYAANPEWQAHGDPSVPKTRGSIGLFMRLPFICPGRLTGWLWALKTVPITKIPPLWCAVQLEKPLPTNSRLHLRPTSRKTHEVNFHASNSAGQPSRLSSQNVNPTTCSSGFQNIWICLHLQRNIPTLLAFTRELQPASEVLSKGWLQAELFMEYIVGDILSIHSFRWHFKLCPQIKLKRQKVTCLNHIS